MLGVKKRHGGKKKQKIKTHGCTQETSSSETAEPNRHVQLQRTELIFLPRIYHTALRHHLTHLLSVHLPM